MKIFIVYCHPSEDSFTRHVRDCFIKGIVDSGNEYVISDLYKMNFKTDMSENEYLRDANYTTTPALADDVIAEQQKINSSDAIAFIYPVFWTEAPAKLVGWFDRVLTYGFAYGNKTMKVLDKALFLCTAGNTLDRLEKFGLLDSMKKVMLGDRLFNRIKASDFVVFEGMTKACALRKQNWDKNLQTAYQKGKNFFAQTATELNSSDLSTSPALTQQITLNDRFFTAVENSESGEVSDKTIFAYHQKNSAIWAEYSGGSIIKGFLVGKIDEYNRLHFSYQHINTKGEVKSGTCDSDPKFERGKLRFYESWKWSTGETGSSIIEEI